MIDHYIFGFGLVVTLLVGFGLATMITVHNRAIESEEREHSQDSKGQPAKLVVAVSDRD